MRRPRFRNWVRSELLRLSGFDSFNLQKLASLAQSEAREDIAPLLVLYAHENGCIDKLFGFIYDSNLRNEYLQVEHHLGKRSIERLALRGTPMMSLSLSYRSVLESYERAYHAPERTRIEKESIRERSRIAMLKLGITPAELAHALDLDTANLHAFIVRGEVDRFTLQKARELETHLLDGGLEAR